MSEEANILIIDDINNDLGRLNINAHRFVYLKDTCELLGKNISYSTASSFLAEISQHKDVEFLVSTPDSPSIKIDLVMLNAHLGDGAAQRHRMGGVNLLFGDYNAVNMIWSGIRFNNNKSVANIPVIIYSTDKDFSHLESLIKNRYGQSALELSACDFIKLRPTKDFRNELEAMIVNSLASTNPACWEKKINICKTEYLSRQIGAKYRGIQHEFENFVSIMRMLNGALRAFAVEEGKVLDYCQKILTKLSEKGKLKDTNKERLNRLVDEFISSVLELRGLKGEDELTTGKHKELSITVIDDEYEDFLLEEYYSLILSPLGCKNVSCLTGSEAQIELERTCSEQLQTSDLVFLDIDFQTDQGLIKSSTDEKKYFGLKLLGRIKEKYPDVPLIMLSVYDELALYQRCRDLGADKYLTKNWSHYEKYKTHSNEREWYQDWIKEIKNSIRFKSFHGDITLLEGANLKRLEEEVLSYYKQALWLLNRRQFRRAAANLLALFYDNLHLLDFKKEKGVRYAYALKKLRNRLSHGTFHFTEHDILAFLLALQLTYRKIWLPERVGKDKSSWRSLLLDSYQETAMSVGHLITRDNVFLIDAGWDASLTTQMNNCIKRLPEILNAIQYDSNKEPQELFRDLQEIGRLLLLRIGQWIILGRSINTANTDWHSLSEELHKIVSKGGLDDYKSEFAFLGITINGWFHFHHFNNIWDDNYSGPVTLDDCVVLAGIVCSIVRWYFFDFLSQENCVPYRYLFGEKYQKKLMRDHESKLIKLEGKCQVDPLWLPYLKNYLLFIAAMTSINLWKKSIKEEVEAIENKMLENKREEEKVKQKERDLNTLEEKLPALENEKERLEEEKHELEALFYKKIDDYQRRGIDPKAIDTGTRDLQDKLEQSRQSIEHKEAELKSLKIEVALLKKEVVNRDNLLKAEYQELCRMKKRLEEEGDEASHLKVNSFEVVSNERLLERVGKQMELFKRHGYHDDVARLQSIIEVYELENPMLIAQRGKSLLTGIGPL